LGPGQVIIRKGGMAVTWITTSQHRRGKTIGGLEQEEKKSLGRFFVDKTLGSFLSCLWSTATWLGLGCGEVRVGSKKYIVKRQLGSVFRQRQNKKSKYMAEAK
jgi:hypothetical protein